MTLARSSLRVRVRAGYEFVSCRRHGDQRLPAGPIATAFFKCLIAGETINLKKLDVIAWGQPPPTSLGRTLIVPPSCSGSYGFGDKGPERNYRKKIKKKMMKSSTAQFVLEHLKTLEEAPVVSGEKQDDGDSMKLV